MASDLIFVGQFVASKAGKTGLTVTVDVDRYTISDGSRSSLVTAGSATEGRRGLYHYRLAAADLSLYQYVATFITSDATVDQQEVAAIGLVVPDTLTSSRLAPTVAGRMLDVSADGEAGLDWANVGGKTSTVALTNTQINSVSSTISANVVQMNGETDPVDNLVLSLGAGGLVEKLNSMLEAAGLAYRFTAEALAEAPSGSGLTAQETADAVNNLAPAGASGAAGSIRSKLDAIQLVTDDIDVSAVTLAPGNNAGSLTFVVGSTFDETVSGLAIPADWTECYFSLKHEKDRDKDHESIAQIKVTNGGDADDGLLYLDGAPPASPITKADAAIAVTQADGTVRIVVSAAAMYFLTGGRSGLDWDVKVFKTGGWSKVVTSGDARMDWTPTRTA